MTYVTTALETECKLPGRTRAMYAKTAKTPMSLGWKIGKQGNVSESRQNSYEFGQEDAHARLPGRTRTMCAKTAQTSMSTGWKISKQGNVSENRQNSYELGREDANASQTRPPLKSSSLKHIILLLIIIIIGMGLPPQAPYADATHCNQGPASNQAQDPNQRMARRQAARIART